MPKEKGVLHTIKYCPSKRCFTYVSLSTFTLHMLEQVDKASMTEYYLSVSGTGMIHWAN